MRFQLVFFFIFNLLIINGERFSNEILSFQCVNPYVTLYIYSSQLNPRWKINSIEMKSIRNLTNSLMKKNQNKEIRRKSSERILGYQGFSISCSEKRNENEIYIDQSITIENYLLKTGRSYLSSEIINHVQFYLGQSNINSNNYIKNLPRINCNQVPIKGPDTVPIYNPLTDNGGCFVTKQLNNNCYAYGCALNIPFSIDFFSFLFFLFVQVLIL